jgi:hypothetical protein
MAERDTELFEALAGDLLGDLGYERSESGVSAGITLLAQERQGQWEAEMMERGAKKLRRSALIKEAESGG